jgi:ATP synthase protein I
MGSFVKIRPSGGARKNMKTVAPLPDDFEAEENAPIKPLSAQEARKLREQHPPVSPWWVVVGQAVVGLCAALVAWGVTGKQNVGWSAGYGALAVVIPAAIFARGLRSRFSSANAGAAAVGFLMWEMVKVASTIVLVAAGPKLVQDLSWPAMLIGLILALKVYWVALAFKPRAGKPASR